MGEVEIEIFLKKVEQGLEEAQENMLAEKALHNSYVAISDGNGGVRNVAAKELLQH